VSFSFHLIPKESTRNETAIYYTVIAILCSLPFRLIFPRNKIKNMVYTDDEQKAFKKKIYIRLAIIALLMTSRILYLKYCWGNL
jgi:cell division protein FtsL